MLRGFLLASAEESLGGIALEAVPAADNSNPGSFVCAGYGLSRP